MMKTQIISITPLDILGYIFLTLKLTGHITWSWWLVLLPFYIIITLGVGLGVVFWVGSLFRKKRRK